MYDALLEIIRTCRVIRDPRITDLEVYGRDTFRVKIRATVTPNLSFQVWLNKAPQHLRYAYQLFTSDRLLLRWDNAPHRPDLTMNFPHHFHDHQGQITSSVLQGDPLQDILVVLAEIEHYLATVP